MEIEIILNDQARFIRDKKNIERLALHAVKTLDIDKKYQVELTIIDNPEMKKLNYRYRGKNESTDVLSFVYSENNNKQDYFYASNINANFLGQIFISRDQARIQAEHNNISSEEEINKLFVHGLLHLLGYDHQTDAQEKEMNQIEKQILN